MSVEPMVSQLPIIWRGRNPVLEEMPFRSSSLKVVPKAQATAWTWWLLSAPEIWDPIKFLSLLYPLPFFSPLFSYMLFLLCLILPSNLIFSFHPSFSALCLLRKEMRWRNMLTSFPLCLPGSCPVFSLLNPTFLTYSPNHIFSSHAEYTTWAHLNFLSPSERRSGTNRGSPGFWKRKNHGRVSPESRWGAPISCTRMSVVAERPHTCSVPYLPFLKVFLLWMVEKRKCVDVRAFIKSSWFLMCFLCNSYWQEDESKLCLDNFTHMKTLTINFSVL